MLLADAIERAELSLETRMEEVLPLISGDVGSVSVQELVTHTSGLPRMPRRPHASLRTLRYGVLQLNPYHGITTSKLLELVADQELSGRGAYRYSNLGAAILGQMLVIRSGLEYADLLRDRLLEPLGLTSTDVSVKGRTVQWGRSPAGLPRQPWTMGGFAPAGGVFSTIADMARLASKILGGAAPGLSSLELLEDESSDHAGHSSGMFWTVISDPSTRRRLVWHTGRTGGYSSLMAISPELHQAVVVLANVGGHTAQIERVAAALLQSPGDAEGS
jgi:CubicO group peptidase (beta-lactamase class C family)